MKNIHEPDGNLKDVLARYEVCVRFRDGVSFREGEFRRRALCGTYEIIPDTLHPLGDGALDIEQMLRKVRLRHEAAGREFVTSPRWQITNTLAKRPSVSGKNLHPTHSLVFIPQQSSCVDE